MSWVCASESEPETALSGGFARPSDRPPVRVAFMIDRLAIGGTETQLLALIRNLDRSRVSPYLVLLDGRDELSKELSPKDCPTLALGVESLRSLRALRPLRELVSFLRREQIDVLQMYFPDSTYFGVIAGRLAGTRAIIRTRNNINHWMTTTHRILGRALNRLVTLTICNSEAGREAVLRDERPDPASVVVVENGVDLERFAHIPPVDPSPGRPRRVGMVANLRHVKGVDIFVRAAALVGRDHPSVEFVVAGEGEERLALQSLVEDLGLSGKFHLLGRVDDIPCFLSTIDIAVLSSRAEGTPNAVLEYMAAGRPLIATKVGGVAALLEDRHGSTVRPDDPAALAAGIETVLDDLEGSVACAGCARACVASKHDRSRQAGIFERLFEDLLNGRRYR